MSQSMLAQNTPPPFVPATFETFGKYILLKKLETGGMAEVFLARPATTDGNGRVAVIKRILPHMAEDPAFIKMFRAEVQVMMGFNHPHLIQLHDCGTIKGRTYIAMEYIEGKTLKRIISTFRDKKEVIPAPMALSLMAQAAAGLSYAHNFENRVTGEVFNAIHRDISPQNLILSYDGNLKVIDFGIAKAAGGGKEQTETGVIKGKVAYLSPEQIQGRELDGRSDIFSLGIVAWEILTSKRPFADDKNNEMRIMQKIQKCDQVILPPSTHNKEIPPAVDAVVMKALRQNPGDRYASAHAFQTAIRQVMRQHYPTYSYADTGELIRVLFEKEIAQERSELRAFNENAQKFLTSNSRKGLSPAPRLVKEMVRGVSAIIPSKNKFQVTSSEAPVRQRTALRNYLMFAAYLLSLVLIKLDDRYDLSARFISHSWGHDSNHTTENAGTSATAITPPPLTVSYYPPNSPLVLAPLNPPSRTLAAAPMPAVATAKKTLTHSRSPRLIRKTKKHKSELTRK